MNSSFLITNVMEGLSNSTKVSHKPSRSMGGTEIDFLAKENLEEIKCQQECTVRMKILWRQVFLHSILHLSALGGIYYLFQARWLTILWAWLLYGASFISVTAGMHRLWSHRSYKASAPMRALLVIFNCIANQNSIIEWVTDHRCHHKWSETDGDPHNANRGLFFSHIGWLLVQKHPDYLRRAKTLDMSDIYADKLVVWQNKYFGPLTMLFCFIIPTVVPAYLWGESAKIAFLTAGVLRYCISLHVTFCVNSVAHKYGYRPYDARISPAENLATAFITAGEGFHNYHHTYPQDYRASEYPWTRLNLTTAFIDFCCYIGWVHDRKTVSQESIDKKRLKNAKLE